MSDDHLNNVRIKIHKHALFLKYSKSKSRILKYNTVRTSSNIIIFISKKSICYILGGGDDKADDTMVSDDFDPIIVVALRDNSDLASVLTPIRVIHRRRSSTDDNDSAVSFHLHREVFARDSGHVDTQKQTSPREPL